MRFSQPSPALVRCVVSANKFALFLQLPEASGGGECYQFQMAASQKGVYGSMYEVDWSD